MIFLLGEIMSFFFILMMRIDGAKTFPMAGDDVLIKHNTTQYKHLFIVETKDKPTKHLIIIRIIIKKRGSKSKDST